MDQSSRQVKSFTVDMEFMDGRVKTIVLSPLNQEINGEKVTAYYRESESHIMNDEGKREHLYTECRLVWSKKEPWVEPEKRGS